MTKEEWQKLWDTLDKIYSDFIMVYPDYDSGRNKNIRTEAKRKVENLICLADLLISKNYEGYILLTGGENISNYSRAIIYDEFKAPRYFGNSLGDFLQKIKEKIPTLSGQ